MDTPLVMGIINATPDSFYAGSRQQSIDMMLSQAEKMIIDGAAILDIGGQSSRPGSVRISADEENARVIPGIEAIRKSFPEIFISVDTYYAAVAREAIAAGADIVNDISAGHMDQQMLSAVASLNVPYVLMHMQGTPGTMHLAPQYEDVTREVLDFFIRHVSKLHESGLDQVIIDPGFGFGKTIAHNFELLKKLEVFSILERPLLLGISRKSTIYKTLGTTPEQALNGTSVLNTIGLLKGASILRVHDVKEATETIRLVSAVQCIQSNEDK
ncbi:MAG: dihydropteroate synthase [Chitinophagaceae bacterium]|nr:MAG: dihydropteroate synthase [Chitinophagaceae bacterium]